MNKLQACLPKFNMNSNNLLIAVLVVLAAMVVSKFSSVGDLSRWLQGQAGSLLKNEGEVAQEKAPQQQAAPQQQEAQQQAPQQQADQQQAAQQQAAQQQAAQQSVVGAGGDSVGAPVEDMKSRDPSQNCINLQGQWISSNLLPKEDPNVDEDWSVMAPGKLEDQNFLEAGHHFGSDTVANSLRNANYQLRSEPAIPKVDVGPWANTTIDADKFRRPFEVEEA
tara:strand:+ start:1673 stop:2338 length:666 start_codon:yes stop_codon:yes gene_type:complete